MCTNDNIYTYFYTPVVMDNPLSFVKVKFTLDASMDYFRLVFAGDVTSGNYA